MSSCSGRSSDIARTPSLSGSFCAADDTGHAAGDDLYKGVAAVGHCALARLNRSTPLISSCVRLIPRLRASSAIHWCCRGVTRNEIEDVAFFFGM